MNQTMFGLQERTVKLVKYKKEMLQFQYTEAKGNTASIASHEFLPGPK